MEGARRIDEWSRIADKVPSLSVVPMLAPVDSERASVLDLLPHEWEVLMMIDSERDLRGIAGALGSSEFEIAKIAYGLLSTGVVTLKNADRPSQRTLKAITDSQTAMSAAHEAMASGRTEDALANARAALAADASSTEARLLVAKALSRLSRYQESVEELRRAVQADPLTPEVHLDLGYAAIRVGDFANARASFEHFLRLVPSSHEMAHVRAALELLTRLQHLLEARADV